MRWKRVSTAASLGRGAQEARQHSPQRRTEGWRPREHGADCGGPRTAVQAVCAGGLADGQGAGATTTASGGVTFPRG